METVLSMKHKRSHNSVHKIPFICSSHLSILQALTQVISYTVQRVNCRFTCALVVPKPLPLWLCSDITSVPSKAINSRGVGVNPMIFFHSIFHCKYVRFLKMRLHKPHHRRVLLLSPGVSEFQTLAFLDIELM